MIKAIIFDWGNTCSRYNLFNVFCSRLSQKTGISVDRISLAYDKYNRSYVLGRITGKQFFHKLSRFLGISDKGLLKMFTTLDKTDPSMITLVKKVRKNYKTAILSDNYKEYSDAIDKDYGHLFDVKVFSNRVRFKKPNKKIYQIVLKRLKLKPSECLYIDDREKNVKNAQKLGIKSILFKNKEDLNIKLTKMRIKIK